MKLQLNKYQKYWTGIWILVFIYLLLGDAVFSNDITYIKDFSRNEYGITHLFPLGRTDVKDDGQSLRAVPLYFTVHTPRRYGSARVNLVFSSSPEDWSIGVQIAPDFNYKLFPLSDAYEQELTIDTTDAYYEANRLRFILTGASPPVHDIDIQYLEVQLTNPVKSYAWVVKENIYIFYETIKTIF